MNSGVLHIIYSVPFGLGLVVGMAAYWLFCYEKCRWFNKHHPKPDGTRYKMGGFNTVYLGAAVALAVLGYVLLQAQNTHDDTVALAKDVARCQAEFNVALKQRSDIGTQDTDLANTQADLRSEQDATRNSWLDRILNPPPDIAPLDRNDPRRQAWVADVTRVFAQRSLDLTHQISDAIVQRKQIQADRLAHPLPATDCGAATK